MNSIAFPRQDACVSTLNHLLHVTVSRNDFLLSRIFPLPTVVATAQKGCVVSIPSYWCHMKVSRIRSVFFFFSSSVRYKAHFNQKFDVCWPAGVALNARLNCSSNSVARAEVTSAFGPCLPRVLEAVLLQSYRLCISAKDNHFHDFRFFTCF